MATGKTPSTPPAAANSDEIRTVREGWVHEDNLLVQRVTWLALFNSFLLAAVASAWDKEGNPAPVKPFIIGICVCGLVVSVSAWIPLCFSVQVMRDIRTWWEDHIIYAKVATPTTPPLIYSSKTWREKLQPWHVLPPVAVVGWVSLLFFVAPELGRALGVLIRTVFRYR